MVSRFPYSPQIPPRKPPLLIHCGRGFARITFHSKTYTSFLAFRGAYKKYPRSYGADHRVCGDHCPTSGHSGPRTPVNDLKMRSWEHARGSPSKELARRRRRLIKDTLSGKGISCGRASISAARPRALECSSTRSDYDDFLGERLRWYEANKGRHTAHRLALRVQDAETM